LSSWISATPSRVPPQPAQLPVLRMVYGPLRAVAVAYSMYFVVSFFVNAW
jgi:hypothetical protein